jgi:hypothetical protein
MYAHKLGIKGAGQVRVREPDSTRPVSISTRPNPPNVKIFQTQPDPWADPTRPGTTLSEQLGKLGEPMDKLSEKLGKLGEPLGKLAKQLGKLCEKFGKLGE